jgi:hypothetical protein
LYVVLLCLEHHSWNSSYSFFHPFFKKIIL